jgi:chromosome segregation ATPase
MGGGSLEALQQQVEGVTTAIQKVEQELGQVKAVLKAKVQGTLPAEDDPYGMTVEELKGYLQALMRNQAQLMDDKKQLREEKAKLMDRQAQLTSGELLPGLHGQARQHPACCRLHACHVDAVLDSIQR